MGTGDLDLVARIGGASSWLAVVSVARADGTVHSSLVNAGLLAHPVTGAQVVGIVARADARKMQLVRASRHATITFRNGWEWVAVEGTLELAGPEDALPGFDPDALPALLRDVFKGAGGTHDDWDEYDRVMAAERRTAILLTPQRITTN
jgi:hypothetical protein